MDVDPEGEDLGRLLRRHGVGRRRFLGFCGAMTTLLALPPGAARAMAQGLAKSAPPSVIWLSFQECTGCTESITRSHSPTIEDLILSPISLDYHHTLMAAQRRGRRAGAAQAARSTTRANTCWWSTGRCRWAIPASRPSPGSATSTCWQEAAEGAAAVICVGTCAAFGGIAAAAPNPTGAVGIGTVVKRQAGGQHSRLPADPGGDDGGAGPLPGLRGAARAGRAWPPGGVLPRDHP